MFEDVVNFIKSQGIGCRKPNDELFHAGDEINKIHKIFGVKVIDEEIFYHKSDSISCHIPGCTFISDTIYGYDQHYNSCHRFSCSQCNKYLPSSYLLDLHLMETHDAYFAALAEKKPMFQCYLQECKKLFQSSKERREHAIIDHQFPSNFRFDNIKKKCEKGKKSNDIDKMIDDDNNEIMNVEKINKKLKKGKKSKDVEMIDDNEIMEIETEKKEEEEKCKSKIKPGRRRKPVLDLDCFVKDLKDSLPST